MKGMSGGVVGTRLFPFLAWIAELRKPGVLRADLIAGVTVALVLVPQSMAYAQLAGLPPYYGLYAAFLPPLVAALFGSSRQLATGPVAVVSLMTAAALEPIASGAGGGYVAYAILLAMLVGMIQLGLGLLRLGVLVNFLSHPVVLGFTNAAALIIATSQLGKIFGVRAAKAEHHYQTVWNTLVAAVEPHLPTAAMALLAFAIMIGLRRLNPRLPGVLIAVIVTSAASWLLEFERHRVFEPAQIASVEVRKVVDDQLRLRRELAGLRGRLAAAEQALAAARRQYGDDHARSLAALHAADSLRLELEHRRHSLQADLRELKTLHFERVKGIGGAPDRLYLSGAAPAAAEVDAEPWRLGEIGTDGALIFLSGGAVVGAIPRGLPAFQAPRLDWEIISELLATALTIALIGFMEAIAIAKSMAAQTRQRLDANQELIGQGLGNLVGSLFQSYAVAGSFSRSAVNLGAGAVTGFSSVVTSLVVVATLLWLTPLLYYLPQATLAAVIMMAVIGLVRVAPVQHVWRAHRHDGAVAVVTFVLTLVLAPHLDQGIIAGVLLSLGLYLYRTMKPRIAELSRHQDGTLRDARVYGLETCDNIAVIRFDRSLYFANTGYFEDVVLEKIAAKPNLRFVVVDAGGINGIDASGEEMLVDLVGRLQAAGIQLLFTRVKKQVADALERTGFVRRLGAEHFFRRTDHALEYAWKQLGDDHAADCPLRISTPVKP